MEREDIIKEECNAELELHDIEYEVATGLEDALELVGEIKAILNFANSWRKVSEGLPDIGVKVLCKFKEGSIDAKIRYGISEMQKNGRFIGEVDWVSVLEWKPID